MDFKKEIAEIKDLIEAENQKKQSKIHETLKAKEALDKAVEEALQEEQVDKIISLEKRMDKLEMMMIGVAEQLTQVKNILSEAVGKFEQQHEDVGRIFLGEKSSDLKP